MITAAQAKHFCFYARALGNNGQDVLYWHYRRERDDNPTPGNSISDAMAFQIVQWLAAGKTVADLELELQSLLPAAMERRDLALAALGHRGPEPPRTGGRKRGGKISAAEKAANTAALLTKMKAEPANDRATSLAQRL